MDGSQGGYKMCTPKKIINKIIGQDKQSKNLQQPSQVQRGLPDRLDTGTYMLPWPARKMAVRK